MFLQVYVFVIDVINYEEHLIFNQWLCAETKYSYSAKLSLTATKCLCPKNTEQYWFNLLKDASRHAICAKHINCSWQQKFIGMMSLAETEVLTNWFR